MKNLYRGTFNFGVTVKHLYAHAYSAEQAKMIMCRRIAKQDDISLIQVLNHFSGDNCSIELEIEFTEDEGGKE